MPTERAITEALAEQRRRGRREGEQRAFEDALRRRSAGVLGEETSEAADLVNRLGPAAALGAIKEAARDTWPGRWRRELGSVIEDMVDAEMGRKHRKARALPAFDPANPRMADWLDSYTSRLADTLSDTSYEQFQGVLRESLQEGLSVPDTAARLRERMPELGRARSDLLARNETLRATKAARNFQALESGLVKTRTRISAGDSRVRPEHAEMDGETVGANELYSNGEQYPGEIDIQCRCVESYTLDPDRAGVQ